jgi:hypothetical protein
VGKVRRCHTPEGHYQKLMSLYEGLVASKAKQTQEREISRSSSTTRPAPVIWNERASGLPQKRRLRVAFVGGRGVISKYSGIETYYEEVGKRLVEMGHEVMVYCGVTSRRRSQNTMECAW